MFLFQRVGRRMWSEGTASSVPMALRIFPYTHHVKSFESPLPWGPFHTDPHEWVNKVWVEAGHYNDKEFGAVNRQNAKNRVGMAPVLQVGSKGASHFVTAAGAMVSCLTDAREITKRRLEFLMQKMKKKGRLEKLERIASGLGDFGRRFRVCWENYIAKVYLSSAVATGSDRAVGLRGRGGSGHPHRKHGEGKNGTKLWAGSGRVNFHRLMGFSCWGGVHNA